MATQLALTFDDVPVTCPAQARYHAIAPVLAGRVTPIHRAKALNVGYATITRWIREFREQGMRGLFDQTQFPRRPYTPEKVIVVLVFHKCCAPKASDRELARVIHRLTDYKLHNETVRDLLDRYFFWKHSDFTDLIMYPVPDDPLERRLEMVRLCELGFTEKTTATLLRCAPRTVHKWLRRHQEDAERGLEERSRARRTTSRKVYLGTIHAVLELQKKYGYAGWFRIKGYLSRDYGIDIGETTLKKMMRMNRRVHLAPVRPRPEEPGPREGPPVSRHPFEHAYIDVRYLDAKPGGVQLYSTIVVDGFSRTILAGALTPRQDLGVVLGVYYVALLDWGCWDVIVSDHGGQFMSHAFARVNRRLGIDHQPYEKGRPWQSLVESQFGIQARLGEYAWRRCPSVEAAADLHVELIRDHNRLPHFAHRLRNDGKESPLEVLGDARGRRIDAGDLHGAFARQHWKRTTDSRGFVRINRWRIYVEEGLPRTPVHVTYWDGKLRAEYGAEQLAEYRCRWDASAQRPKTIASPTFFETPYRSAQTELFDPLWVRDPEELDVPRARLLKPAVGAEQLRLYLGPSLVR